MNTHQLLFLLISSFFSACFSMETSDSAKQDLLKQIVRYSTSKQFELYLKLNDYLITLVLTKTDSNTALHELAYPFSQDELAHYNQKYKRNYTLHQIAQFHAYKIDLLLRDNVAQELLKQSNIQGMTPGMLAAQKGHLPVMARIMLSNPSDWREMITNLEAQHKKTLVDSFLNYDKSRILPLIDDLQIPLTVIQSTNLVVWAATFKHSSEQSNDAWTQLDHEQTKHLFECYLALDIRKQCEENPNYPTAKAVLGN